MSRPTSMKVDGTVYWTLMTYDADGILINADSNPSVSVRKNGVATGDAVSVTKRGSSTGIYECAHNPSGEIEGDTFGYEEVVVLSSVEYQNPWNLEVLAAERGTDNANTVAPDNASVTAILADTADLQANQGQWLTATTTVSSNMRGTDNANTVTPNTVAPDNAAIQEIKGEVSDLYGNQSQWLTATTTVSSNMRGTDNANTVAPDNTSIASILADTDDLQSNQSQWLTATTTVSSNMRGTDLALLASDAPTHFDIMAINSSGAITTSNPSTGGTGSDHTAEDVAALILAVPTTPLGNTPSGSLALVDTTTNLTNGGGSGGGDSAADIYNYFTADNREDAFQADVSGLATYSQVNGVNSGIIMAINQLNDFNPQTDVVAHVTLCDTTTNLTNGGSGGSGSSPADIYSYFITQNLVPFQADVSALALEATLDTGVQEILNTGNTYWTTGSGGGSGGDITIRATQTPRAF
ncbi:MAG: hypothetical protein ACR2NF_08800 [Pirellulales bacterium]